MYLSTSFMSNVIGVIAIFAYIAAPFLENPKKALIYRIVSELLLALMFFYIGCLAGVAYCVALALSFVLEKQIESNKVISIIYGIIACIIVLLINNNGFAGKILGISLLLVYSPINEEKMLTTSSFIDVVTSLALLYYSISVRSLSAIIFSVLLFIVAIAGLFSAARLVKGGGLKAAAAENELYNRQHKNNKKSSKKKGK